MAGKRGRKVERNRGRAKGWGRGEKGREEGKQGGHPQFWTRGCVPAVIEGIYTERLRRF